MRTAIFLGALMSCLASFAMAFDDGDRAAVEQAVKEFETAFEAGDWEAILPPDHLFDVLASLSGKDTAELRRAALAAMAETMATVEITSYDIRTEDMVGGESRAGALYADIPSVTRVILEDSREVEIESRIFAAKLDDGWHLFRLEGAQNKLLFLRAYPQFEGVVPPQ